MVLNVAPAKNGKSSKAPVPATMTTQRGDDDECIGWLCIDLPPAVAIVRPSGDMDGNVLDALTP
jgi:hypothetical protein